jgi:aspartate aminotransferase-like enzyme
LIGKDVGDSTGADSSLLPGPQQACFPASLAGIRLQAFLGLVLVLGYWQSAGKHTDHHTAPINPIYGLHESLVMLEEERLENA